MSVEELASRLIQNVVRISAPSAEHGFGLVVGRDDRFLFIATANHVITADSPARAGESIEIRPCASPGNAAALQGEVLATFGPPDDVAFLKASAPASYSLDTRALSPANVQALRDPALQIGRSDECVLNARDGRLSMLRDANNNLRIDITNGIGGDSGGPALTGRGVIGIVRTAGETNLTIQSIDYVMELARRASIPWSLVDARNIPPTTPEAAAQDLSQTLNEYLWHLRDVHGLLLQPTVDKARFTSFVDDYNRAIRHFSEVKEKYDGTLQKFWGVETLAEWQRLRDQLWSVHLNFWNMNQITPEIFSTQRTPKAARKQLLRMEPDLQRLQTAIEHFADQLDTWSNDNGHGTPPPN